MDDPAVWTLLAGGVAAILGAIAIAIRAAVTKAEPPAQVHPPAARPPFPSADASGQYPPVLQALPAPDPGTAFAPVLARFEQVLDQMGAYATHADIEQLRAAFADLTRTVRRLGEQYEAQRQAAREQAAALKALQHAVAAQSAQIGALSARLDAAGVAGPHH